MNTGKDGQLIFTPPEYREQQEDKKLLHTCAVAQSILYELQIYIKNIDLKKQLSEYHTNKYKKVYEIQKYNKIRGFNPD